MDDFIPQLKSKTINDSDLDKLLVLLKEKRDQCIKNEEYIECKEVTNLLEMCKKEKYMRSGKNEILEVKPQDGMNIDKTKTM